MTDSTALTTTTSNNQALDQLAECQRTGHWPGYGDLVQEPIDLPGWCRD